jgi:SAM-dependent methyltransferase
VQLGKNTAWADRFVNFLELQRLSPYRPAYGWFRGECIDRYYIESFLRRYALDIHGCVLEISEPVYTRKFGGRRVDQIEVLDVDPTNPKATIIADLTSAGSIPDKAFDAIICTQTLQYIYDFRTAFAELYRMLRPGGVLIATFPGIAQLCPPSMIGTGRDYWRFTHHSVRELAQQVFESENVEIDTFGNVYAALGFLHGLVSSELSREELDFHDENYQVIIGLRARKAFP